ncbi:MAG: phosphate acyltransferase [Gammaproteobacteria bacterium SG8_31]|jgi:glycerol-3-phosphate acyltransferase PlsX|nr:MAG: phosphate acyltransferase [Gammaproteobacteria bacterium SG8_31]
MAEIPVIAIDAMGGDLGPQVIVPAVADFLRSHQRARVRLVGRREQLETLLGEQTVGDPDRVDIVDATQVVSMDELPADALRKKKDSSMRVALNLVRDGQAHACVSAGNTGALMATARYVLKTLAGIDRPAIMSAIPAKGGHTHMLDLGANAHCTPQQLVQFAVMGTVVAGDIHGLERPRVGLLNIGTEEIKGNETIRLAGQLMARSELNYVGFVEGYDIMSGRVDVVVTDGFTGNVALKTMEGVARMLFETAREEIAANWINRLGALAAAPLFRSIRDRVDPRRYNGASLVGLNGIVIKSHGGADAMAFCNAIRTALVEAQKGVPTQIGDLLERQRTILEQAV